MNRKEITMLSRRHFIKTTLCAGVALGAGFFGACGRGSNRVESDPEALKRVVPFLDPATHTILYHASLAPSGHNTQPWRVRIVSPDTWIVEADPQRRLPAVDPQNRELLLSLGAFVENLVLSAAALGRAADIQVIGREPHDRDMIRIALHSAKPVVHDLQLLRKRRTVKQGHQPKEIIAADVQAMADRTDGHLVYFPRGSAHAACLRDAAVESFRIQAGRDEAQREFTQWLRLSDRAVRDHRDGLSPDGMEITGIKGWYLRHFAKPADFMKAAFRRQAVDVTAELAAQGGGWFVITSPGETVADLIDAGRRFQGLALRARELGIGIHPMTQMLEEEKGLARIAANHRGGWSAQFVLRAGYITNYPEPASPRRPVHWFTYNPRA